MSLLWADGFDGIEDWANETDAGAYYDYWQGFSALSLAYGRRASSRGLGMASSTSALYVTKNIPASTTIYVGTALRRKLTYLSTAANEKLFLVIGPVYFLIVGANDHHIEARYGSTTGTLLGTSSAEIPLQSWVYHEVGVVISETVGAVTIKMDGITVLDLTGLNLGTTDITAVSLIPSSSFSTNYGFGAWFDDFYICDGLGTVNNDFLGDVRIDSYAPTSDGTAQDWTRSTGVDTYALLDENPPDATDYVESQTLNNAVTTKVTAADTGRTILGVMSSAISNQSEGAGIIRVTPQATNGSTVNGDEVTLLDTYQRCPQILETAPDTTAWDYTKLAATEFGLKVTSVA